MYLTTQKTAELIDAIGITWRAGSSDQFMVNGINWPRAAVAQLITHHAHTAMGITIAIRCRENDVISELDLIFLWVRQHRRAETKTVRKAKAGK